MSINFIKFASRLLLTNPKARKLAGQAMHVAYKKAKPVIKKQTQIIRDTIEEAPPGEDVIKFAIKLKNKIKKNS
tara:strand:+ start:525 stop:746 length:222 start_codon:yes stop_codon:yes gene_type:complete